MEIIVGPITELVKSSFPFIKRQTGYSTHYKAALKDLKEKVEDLERTRNDVQLRVDAARRNLETIHERVEMWLAKVAKAITRDADQDEINIVGLVMNGDQAINMYIKKSWFPAVSGSRYNLGRKAAKKMFILDELLNERKDFGDNISSPGHIDINPPMSINNQNDYEPFESRENLRKEVMAALQDEGANLIGIYGMGGVGKTTLAIQVYNQVKKEKLFDEVVMIPMSQYVDLIQIQKIQNDIAHMLGLADAMRAADDNAFKRAALLSKRLKQNPTLVILDNLWHSPLQFSEWGIPCGENGCKIIFTTRKLDVCTRLGCTKIINVDVLSEDDSWRLFRKNVGDLASSFETTARKISQECGGLPVALVTLGSGLKDQKKHKWDDTLRQLRNSHTTYIDDMEPKVFLPIKLSYDFLEKEIYKEYFLLCSLFPDDHKIKISDLMPYVVGDEEMTLNEMVDKIKIVLDELVDSCLLLKKKHDKDMSLNQMADIESKRLNEEIEEGVYVVSMHDVIRDVAIHIASLQKGHRFLVRAAVGLKAWPQCLLPSSGTTECSRSEPPELPCRISLMKNEITVLPDEPPELPRLLSLSLYGNKSLKKIPDSFFQRMGSLATLDLRETGISSLPSSISFLVNLKALYLDGCKFNRSTSNISVIGMLKKLEILSLAFCGLDGLPNEIRELTNLRFLNLENNYNPVNIYAYFTIPRNVLSRLSKLEYLNMLRCNIRWEVEGRENGNNASLAEVASLPLSGLNLFFYENEEKFDICFSGAVDIMGPQYYGSAIVFVMPVLQTKTKNICFLKASPPVCPSIKALIEKVECLELQVCTGLRSVGQIGARFDQLKELRAKECRELKYVMNFVVEAEIDSFVALERLILDDLEILKWIFVGLIPIGVLDRLTFVEINKCHEMVSVLDANLGESLPNLEFLNVTDCGKLEDVFNIEAIDGQEAELSDITFSKLREMVFEGLPVLENIWKGNLPPVGCFENLEVISVYRCDKLRYLFSSSMVRNLQNLKELSVSSCKGMVNIIASERVMVYHDNLEVDLLLLNFPNLKVLVIRYCKNLKQFWDIGTSLVKEEEEDDNDDDIDNAEEEEEEEEDDNDNDDDDDDNDIDNDDDDEDDDDDDLAEVQASILDFPSVEMLCVVGCKKLKRIHLTHQCTLQLEEIVGDDEEWFEKLEWENPNDKLRMQPLFEVEVEDDEVGIDASELNFLCRPILDHALIREEEAKRIKKGKMKAVFIFSLFILFLILLTIIPPLLLNLGFQLRHP